MLITFSCTNCQQKLEVGVETVGAQVECPACRAALTVPRTEIGTGVTIGGFRIERLLGAGGMGQVYLARQLSLDREIALKILPAQLGLRPEAVQRFLSEVKLLARLEHPNIVTAHEAGEDSGVLFLAMAYVRGESLAAKLKRVGPLPEAEALQLTEKVAGALAYAWGQHQLLHRDIKPDNILLDTNGEPKLVDLGLAKSLTSAASATVSGMVMGTPNYMSPEQAQGLTTIDYRTDIYSLGMTLYHMVSGRVPFASSSLIEILRKQIAEPLPDPRQFNPQVSEPCVALLEAMLAKEVDSRHTTWELLIADLERVRHQQPPSQQLQKVGGSVLLRLPKGAGSAGPVAAAAPPPQKKFPVRLAMTLVAAVVAVVLTGWQFLVTPHKPPGARVESPSPPVVVSAPVALPPVPVAIPALATTPNRSPLTVLESLPAGVDGQSLDHPDRWKNAVNLLPQIDLAQDVLRGTWKFQADGLASDAAPNACLELPYQPPEEYDFRITFTRRSGSQAIHQILYKAGRSFEWFIGVNSSKMGFMRINGREFDNPTTIIKPNFLVSNRRYTSIVAVRNQSVAADLDGVRVANWQTDYHEMDGPYSGFKLNHAARLGIGSFASATVFHSIEVLEVTGRGAFPRVGPFVPAAAASPLVVAAREPAQPAAVLEAEVRQPDAVRPPLAAVLEKAATAVLQLDWAAARNQVTTALADTNLQPVAGELSAANDLLTQLAALPETLLAGYERETGKTITIELQNSGSKKVTVLGINAGKIKAQQELAAGQFAERNFSIADLTAREKSKRLEANATPAGMFLRGYLWLADGNVPAAEREFGQMGPGLGAVLSATIRQRTATQQLAAKEPLAKQAFAEILKSIGLAASQTNLAEVIGSKVYSTNQVAKTQALVAEFQKKYGATATAQTNVPVLAALAEISTEEVFKPVPMKAATDENVKAALAKLQQGQRLMTPPVYKITGGTIELILTNNIGLRDISALAGLPIAQLRLSETSVKNLQPLAGMPLKVLKIGGTKVRDLTPLHKIDSLQELECGQTEVSDLGPLHGLTRLNWLLLHDCKNVRDLTPLQGVDKITRLDITGTSVESLLPLKDIQVGQLILGGSVNDLSPLAGKKIGTLGLRGAARVDLSVLTDTQIGMLDLGAPMRRLKPAKSLVVDIVTIFNDWTQLDGVEQLPETLPELRRINFYCNRPPADCPVFVFRFQKLQMIAWSTTGRPLAPDEFKETYLKKVKK